jgi:acetyltransferase-like isoleucine patch superfamily enzyme
MAVLDRARIDEMGFASVGENVAISDKASIYNCRKITLGNNVRIDDFCVISAGIGGITFGDYIHIAVFCSLIGAGAITLSDYANLSSRVAVYSSTDDFSGEWMTNPTIPPSLTGVSHADVLIGRHVIIGSGSVILPGVTLGDGSAVGALSLIKRDCEPFGIYAGIPARKIGARSRRLITLEKQLEDALVQDKE